MVAFVALLGGRIAHKDSFECFGIQFPLHLTMYMNIGDTPKYSRSKMMSNGKMWIKVTGHP